MLLVGGSSELRLLLEHGQGLLQTRLDTCLHSMKMPLSRDAASTPPVTCPATCVAWSRVLVKWCCCGVGDSQSRALGNWEFSL